MNRGALMVERLITLGFPVTFERVNELRGDASLGRPHIARALVEAGVVASIDEAFDRFLSPGMPGYVDTPRIPSEEAIALAHEAGGIISIAHASVYKNPHHVVDLLTALGADAIEAFHPDVPLGHREQFLDLASQRGLLITGGSDDHGFEGSQTIGTCYLSDPHLQALSTRLGL
jgi:hypothetical protein